MKRYTFLERGYARKGRDEEGLFFPARALSILLLLVMAAAPYLSLSPPQDRPASLSPFPAWPLTASPAMASQSQPDNPIAEVGTGWSAQSDPSKAVPEALQMALAGKRHQMPHFLLHFATAGSDLSSILRELRRAMGPAVAVFGGTSDSRWVMSDKGLIRETRRGYKQALGEEKRALALMTVYSPHIRFGVGSASFSRHRFPGAAARSALLAAMHRAGRPRHQRPRLFLLLSTHGQEEEVVRGIESVVGKDTPILGGTARGALGPGPGRGRGL